MNPQEMTKVIILTRSYRINGYISLNPNARVTDFMHSATPFIAVANAEVRTLDGKQVLVTSFLDVNRDHIEIIAPNDPNNTAQ
ncbi:MAG: hypothetical protein HY774_01320 [Acidobacteria bacterium]|nr:hypothetical protein [Acidobacteriota bacterium]